MHLRQRVVLLTWCWMSMRLLVALTQGVETCLALAHARKISCKPITLLSVRQTWGMAFNAERSTVWIPNTFESISIVSLILRRHRCSEKSWACLIHVPGSNMENMKLSAVRLSSRQPRFHKRRMVSVNMMHPTGTVSITRWQKTFGKSNDVERHWKNNSRLKEEGSKVTVGVCLSPSD